MLLKGENMAVDQELVDNADISVEVVEENMQNVATRKEIVAQNSTEITELVAPMVKSIVVGGPILMNISKSHVMPSSSKSPL
jgi:hypothetical protein